MNTPFATLCKYLLPTHKYHELLKERDTSDVWRQLAIWILVNPKDGFIRFTKPDSDQHDVIKHIAQLYIDDCKDIQTWKTAARAAYAAFDSAAARAATFAARSVAIAAYEDADASYCAALNAFHASASAAEEAYLLSRADYTSSANYSAAFLAGARAAYVATFAASKAKMRKKLLKLIKAAPLIHASA